MFEQGVNYDHNGDLKILKRKNKVYDKVSYIPYEHLHVFILHSIFENNYYVKSP